MNRRAFLQSVTAVPLAAVGMPRVQLSSAARLYVSEKVWFGDLLEAAGNISVDFDFSRVPQLDLSPEALSESAIAWAHWIDQAAVNKFARLGLWPVEAISREEFERRFPRT